MPKNNKFWKDSLDDIIDGNFAADVRERALVRGITIGEATRQICEELRPDYEDEEREIARFLQKHKLSISLDEFALRSIRVMHSTAGERLRASARRLLAAECADAKRFAEQLEFESSFASDPATARSLWDRAQKWWSRFREWTRKAAEESEE